MKSIILFLGCLISFQVASAQELKVWKSAALCTGTNQTNCTYTNPSWELKCHFFSDGLVTIDKSWIAGMVGPQVPIFTLDKKMTEAETEELLFTLRVVKENPNTEDKNLPFDSLQRYSLYGQLYNIKEDYRALVHKENKKSPLEIFVARKDGYGIEQLLLPEAQKIVDIADKYCQWSALKKVSTD